MRIFIGILITLGIFAALVLVQVIAEAKKTGSENSYQYLCRALRFAGRKSIRIFYGCALASQSTQYRSFSRRRYSRRYHYAAVKFNLYLKKTEHPTIIALDVLFFFQKIFQKHV